MCVCVCVCVCARCVTFLQVSVRQDFVVVNIFSINCMDTSSKSPALHFININSVRCNPIDFYCVSSQTGKLGTESDGYTLHKTKGIPLTVISDSAMPFPATNAIVEPVFGEIRPHRRESGMKPGPPVHALADLLCPCCGCTCTGHSGAKKAHNWAVEQHAVLFRTTSNVKTTQADKIREYRADYNNRPSNSISFMPAVVHVASTSGCLHCELVRILFFALLPSQM